MGLADVLSLPQVPPDRIGLTEGYDSWTPRVVEGGQVFVHWGGKAVSSTAANGVVSAERAVLRSWERYHVSNGYAGIAYDWAIGNSGTLYRLRGKARSAATSGDVDRDRIFNNVEGDGVVLLVGQGQDVSHRALATLHEVLDAFGRDVFTHREAKGTITSCAGEQLQRWVQQYRSGNLSSQRQHRAVAVSALREPDIERAKMLAHRHAFAYVEPRENHWIQHYPDGVTKTVHDIDYMVGVGWKAQSLIDRVGDGVAVAGGTSNETRLAVIEKMADTNTPRRRPWAA